MASRSTAGGWLQGKTIRKAGTASSTRSSTPSQFQSTSTTVYGGGVKDASGRTTEYFVTISRFTNSPPPLNMKSHSPWTTNAPFNKRREDFPDLYLYNDYLEDVENITFNLINEVDVPQTEARIAAYRAENAALIEMNLQREEAYAQALKEQEEAERREREIRALELRREEEEEREEREKGKREIIDKLETSDKDAIKLVAKTRAIALKRVAARSASASVLQSHSKLLRSRAAQSTVVPDVPHVPLQDDYYAYEDKFQLGSTGYDDLFSDAVRQDREGIMRGGGYIVEEAWDRALRCAVAALDVPPLVGLQPVQNNDEQRTKSVTV
ncbi:hypothetical protein AX17_003420 [Amanita inopinata Kibby_2008]|nr:hypothetical protein AX17_003420 [Amanita inopinata Kibby_2008]